MPDNTVAETQAHGRCFAAELRATRAAIDEASCEAPERLLGSTAKQRGKDGCPNVKR